ncbi:putative diphthamide synthesis protein-domain-containing protein, partial [Blyttiomyces helicus]
FNERYDIDRCLAAIAKGSYKNIALQFPDELLPDSVQVAATLAERSGRKCQVLADTTFGSCCVDEIAAEHGEADLIIHYGGACLSPTSRLPVIYVFGKSAADIPQCVEAFEQRFKTEFERNILLMFDVQYHYIAGKSLAHSPSCVSATPPLPSEISSQLPPPKTSVRGSRWYSLPDGHAIENYDIFYLGPESLSLTNIMMTHSRCKVYSFNPAAGESREESASVNRLLMRRYMMVQKARDADVIGIVVGTLGVASYLSVINDVKRLILASGKKPYVLAVGKPNPAKLGNFLEIDAFVLVACPENSLIDSRDFFRPIVTPFELELALVPGREWDGSYETDIASLALRLRTEADAALEDARGKVERREAQEDADEDSDDEPYFSLVTGAYKKKSRLVSVAAPSGDGAEDAGQVTLRNKETGVAVFRADSAAADFLRERRTFRGLETRLGETSVSVAIEGRAGIARGYSHE